MARSLVPCPHCARFVYADEGECPFCKTSLASGTPRAAILAALALGASLSGSACRSDRLHEQTVEVYGAPSYQPLPATDAAVPRPAPVDVPSVVDAGESVRAGPAYGLPPPAIVTPPPARHDTPHMIPAYGASPPPRRK